MVSKTQNTIDVLQNFNFNDSVMSSPMLKREKRSASLVAARTENVEPSPFPAQNERNCQLQIQGQVLKKQLARFLGNQDHVSLNLKAVKIQSFNANADLKHMRVAEICAAKKLEEETEKHLLLLTETQLGKLQQDIRQLETDNSSYKERKTNLEKKLNRQKHEIRRRKDHQHFDEQTFSSWKGKVLEADQLKAEIEKFHNSDSAAISEIVKEFGKLNMQIQYTKEKLQGVKSERAVIQSLADKTQKDIKKSQQERHQLIERWEDAVMVLQQTNKKIANDRHRQAVELPNQIYDHDNPGRNREENFEDIQSLEKETDGLKRTIKQLLTKLGAQNELFNTLTAKFEDLSAENLGLISEKKTIQSTNKQNQVVCENLKAVAQERRDFFEKHEHNRSELEKESQNLKSVHQEESLQQGQDELIRKEETRNRILQKDIAKYKEKLASLKLSITCKEEQERHLELEQIQLRKIDRNQKKELKHLEAEMRQFSEKHISENPAVSQVQELSHLPRKLESSKTYTMIEDREEQRSLNELENLNKREAELFEKTKSTESAIKKTEADVAKTINSSNASHRSAQTLLDTLKQKKTENEKLQISVEKSVEENQARMMQADMLKLKAQKLGNKLREKETEVAEAGKKKEDRILEQRTHLEELKFRKFELQAENNTLQEQRRKLKLALNQSDTQIGLIEQRAEHKMNLGLNSPRKEKTVLTKTLSDLETKASEIEHHTEALKMTIEQLNVYQ